MPLKNYSASYSSKGAAARVTIKVLTETMNGLLDVCRLLGAHIFGETSPRKRTLEFRLAISFAGVCVLTVITKARTNNQRTSQTPLAQARIPCLGTPLLHSSGHGSNYLCNRCYTLTSDSCHLSIILTLSQPLVQEV